MASIAKAVSCLLALTALLALFHMDSVAAKRGHPKGNFLLMPGRRSQFGHLQENQRREDLLESATTNHLAEDDSTQIDLQILREIEKFLKAQSSSKTYMKPFMQGVEDDGAY